MSPYSLIEVQQALALTNFDGQSAQLKMMPARARRRADHLPGKARLSGVLVLLFCNDQELTLVLTRRRDDLPAHAGQVSFPGGRHEPPETLLMTALRETEEEIGIAPESLQILGALTPLYIPPSDFEVHPFVAWYHNGQRPFFTPSPDEVAELLEVPLAHLFDPATLVEERWLFQGHEIDVPYFDVEGHKVWGATAMMLSELCERLRVVHKTAKI
jgi:8-oxo-dGTP pyrophosphatase MutT (NUDIX family)